MNGRGYLRRMEECFADLDDVLILHLDKAMKATLCEFMIRYPEVYVFCDSDSVYLCPTKNSLLKLKNLMIRRQDRVLIRYEKSRRDYDSVVSILESISRYV